MRTSYHGRLVEVQTSDCTLFIGDCHGHRMIVLNCMIYFGCFNGYLRLNYISKKSINKGIK